MEPLREGYIDKLDDFLQAVGAEVQRAKSIHKSEFHSVHEGYAVIKEEIDELWNECKVKHPDQEKLTEETVQAAAMLARFYCELLNK